MTLSLGQLAILASELSVSASELLHDDSDASKTHVSFGELAALIHSYLQERGMPVASFEKQVGWEVEATLQNPERFWLWNCDGLADLCGVLGISWRAALPANVPPDGTEIDPWPR